MPRAIVLNSASKLNTTGGTFADALVANAGDSLAVANFNQGGAKILEFWGIDSDSVAEGELIYTRPEATHDQQHGFRFEIPSIALGGAGTNAAFNFLPGYGTIDLYKSDVPQILVTSTANDDILVSWVTLYDDLPGVNGVFCTWPYIQQHQKSAVGIQVTAVASATAGAYGAQRAFNADDDRLHANTWYAILGASVQTQVTTISLLGPDWGGQRVGMPSGSLDLRSNTWFVDQSVKWGNLACIPVFNSNNKGNVLVQVADSEASTSPKIDFFLYELDVPNTQTPGG
jgi:hypothetical protein